MIIKNTYHFDDLECRECAEQVIDIIEHSDNVINVIIDFDNKDITITGKRAFSYNEIKRIVNKVINEEHTTHNDGFRAIGKTVIEEYSFEDIDCPNCAAKVERALNKNKDIIDAQVNFINKKIIIKHNDNCEVYNIVTKIVKSVESDAKVYRDNHKHSSSCSCHHHNDKKSDLKKQISVSLIFFGIYIYALAILLNVLGYTNIYTQIMFIISYILLSYDIIYNALVNIINKDFFSESTLMLIASLGAVIINEPIEGIMVILLYKIGEFCQDQATEKSKNAIKSLVDMKVDEVTLKDGTTKKIEDVTIGEIVTIKVGERIPLDGIVINGKTEVDMKALTGESMPSEVNIGEEILSGSINLTRVIDIEVTKESTDSTMNKVLRLVEEASNQKSKSEQFITKFARVYTPCVLLIAIIVGIIQSLIIKDTKTVFNNVFTILVISCPCALVISIPLGYFAGIGRASNDGILVKGGNYLEALTKVETIVMDKTGTITKGNFKVLDVVPSKNHSKEEIINYVTAVEQYSLHPIACSIKKEFGENKAIKNASIEEVSGEGMVLKTNNQVVVVGNEKIMKRFSIPYTKCPTVGTILYVSVNSEYYGCVVIGDEIKEEAPELFTYLKKENIKTVMLTGDSEIVGNDVLQKLSIDEAYSKLLPNQKYEVLQNKLKNKNGTIVYVGDGINDTPSLKLADVGIAMGAVGSDSAKEASDIVIMNDDILKIKDAIDISKYTRRIVKGNIIFALTIKVIALIIGITGIMKSLGMLIAIFADVGTCLICILNAMKILKYKKRP